MRFILSLFILFSIPFVACNSSEKKEPEIKATADNVFATVDHDKVIAYQYNGEGGGEIIDEDGQLSKRIEKQKELSPSQVTNLTNFLCNPSTYGGDVAACFDPHFGVVFYNHNKPSAYVSICLDCNTLVSSIKIPADKGGFSIDGMTRIVAFEKELGFDTSF